MTPTNKKVWYTSGGYGGYLRYCRRCTWEKIQALRQGTTYPGCNHYADRFYVRFSVKVGFWVCRDSLDSIKLSNTDRKELLPILEEHWLAIQSDSKT